MASRHNIKLSIDGLSLSRGERALIEGLNLALQPGDALWLTGPNGIGKTTVLMACAGLLTPDSGALVWSTQESGFSTALLPPQSVAYSAHSGPERDGLTLGEELSFWQTLYKDTTDLASRLSDVGLEGRDDTPVAGLSAGQRRRLSLARLMSSGRAAWLMDEPLSGLDDAGQALVTQVLGAHLKDGGISIIASHRPVAIKGVVARKLVLEAGT